MIEIDNFLKFQAAVSSARTVEYYTSCLNQFNDFLLSKNITSVSSINTDIFLEYIIYLKQRNIKNTSINTYTRAVRVWCSWLIDNCYIINSFCHVKKLRDDSTLIVPLTNSDVELIDSFLTNNRNYIIFHLMLDCGLRRQEVINLNIDDVHPHFLAIKNSKYNKSRFVPLPDFLFSKINCYLHNRISGPLLLTKSGCRLSVDAIKKLFYNLKKQTYLPIHPHMLRHSFATSFIFYGGNLEILRIILGHSSYNVTQNYLHLAADALISNIDLYKLDSIFLKKKM